MKRWTAGLILLCAGCLWLRVEHIERTLPYPRDIDEPFVSGPASRTVVTGTLHPYTFTYPSLPKYLAAAGMAAGFLRSAAHHEIRDVSQIDNVGYPYYKTPLVMGTARLLFALVSIIALASTGAAAWLTFRAPATIVLAPLVLATSPLFFYHSWAYLNVDIVGVCFAMLTLVACLQGLERPSLGRSAMLPGVFAGLATGSKYTLVILLLPVLLAIAVQVKPGRRLLFAAGAVIAATLSFLIVVPYSLIDIPGVLNGVASEAYHYAGGHPGYDGPPGVTQLMYYGQHYVSEFGVGGLMLAAIGAYACSVADWRRAVVLFSLPVGLLWLLAVQRVHFERNVLSLHPIVAMCVAWGVLCSHRWIVAFAGRQAWTSPPRERAVRILAGAGLLLIAVPLWHVRDQLRDPTDSRNRAQAWIAMHLPPGVTLVVPAQLGFDTSALKARAVPVVVVDLQSAHDPDALLSLLSPVQGPAMILVPRWGADPRVSGQQLADTLNNVSRRWHIGQDFGTNPVLVNYRQPNPWGDPAFGIAMLDRDRQLN